MTNLTQMPPKTAWTVVWFTVLGTGLWFGYFGGDFSYGAEASGPVPGRGPLVGGAVLGSAASTVSLSGSDPQMREDPFGLAWGAKGGSRRPHQPLDLPKNRDLCRLYHALDEIERGASVQPVRILHYGDSILTTDELSGRIRRVFQKRFGDAGHGFVLLGRPWRWYHHNDVVHGARGEWLARPMTSHPYQDGLYGLGGVAFETKAFNAKAWVGTTPTGEFGGRADRFDLSFLEQPGGGSFDVILNGEVVETVSTRSDVKKAAHRVFRASGKGGKLTIKTLGNGRVRVFGAVLESDGPGVVYDSLAVNGARFSTLQRFDREHWSQELRRRDPAMVVLMFGANEGHNKSVQPDSYRRELAEVIRTIRKGAPDGECLVVGPMDQAKRSGHGLISRKNPQRVSELQKQTALEQGCAFFDTFEAMGGQGSMARWFRSGLGGGDLIHPTEVGARQIGSWIADAVLAGYENYIFKGGQCVSTVSSLSLEAGSPD